MFGFHRHSAVSDTMCVQLIHHQLIPFLCNLSSHIISNMPSSNASRHPGCCLCGSSRSPRHFSLLIHFGSTPAWLWLTMVLVKSMSCCELNDQTTRCVCVCICVCALTQPHHARQSSGTDTARPQSNGTRLQWLCTLRGVGTRLFNQGHLAYLLFSPQPAFHPAPGEQGDR